MIEMGPNVHGKSAIRVVRVDRDRTPHRIRDLTVAISLEGNFGASYTEGDNTDVIATDTMKNTAYALAPEHLTGAIETYGLGLGRHFLEEPQVSRATVAIDEQPWRPIDGAPDAFSRDGSMTRTADVRVGREGVEIRAGIRDLSIIKTSRSAFAGFPRDRFTTLADTDDRIMATKATTWWRYASSVVDSIDFDAAFEAIRSTFLDVFADHDSASVQHSIWIIGKAILEKHREVEEISMSMPNLHHWTVDLAQFGIDNDRQIYVATTEPHGQIEATIRRTDGTAERS